MSLRKLPELAVTSPKGDMTFDVEPKALAAWDSNVVAASNDDAVIHIMEPIGEDFFGVGITGKSVSAALNAIGPNPVTVMINSPGGNFFDGLAIYNLLRAHPAMVTVQIVGIAASAASMIAMAGDKIEIARTGLMMIHNSQWIAVGDRHAMQEAHDTMEVFDQALVALYVDRTAEPDAEIGRMLDATTFLSGEKAIELGFADEFLERDKIATTVRASADRPPAYHLEAALARHGMPRAERRKILKEIAEGTPRAATETATPGAGEPAVDDGTVGLSLVLARLKLMRA